MSSRKAEVVLVFIVLAVSSSYLFTKLGMASIEPFNLIALRFLIAFAALAAVCFRRLLHVSGLTIGIGALLGVLMFAILVLQALGLSTVTTTEGAFLSSTTVVFVPILQVFWLRRFPRLRVAAGVLTTMAGIALLTGVGSVSVTQGAAMYLAGAVIYGVHILVVDHFADRVDAFAMGLFELLFAGLMSLVCSFAFETPHMPASGMEWACVLGLALLCSGLGMGVQPAVQRHTTPERYGVLFGLSPLFSAVMGFVVLGESIGVRGWIGAALMLAGVFVVVLAKDGVPKTRGRD